MKTKKKKPNKLFRVGLRIQVDFEKLTAAPTAAQATRKAKNAIINSGFKIKTSHFDKSMDNPMDIS